jgi:hypothetical protein
VSDWDEQDHPRHPAKTAGGKGGRFRDKLGWRASLGSVDSISLSIGDDWSERVARQITQSKYRPGAWMPDKDPGRLVDERRAEAAAFMQRDGLPAVSAAMQAADMFRDIDPPNAVYRNGPHVVAIESDRDDIPIRELLDWVDELQRNNSASGPIRISVVSGDFEASGQTHPPAASILLNEKVFDEWRPESDSVGMPIQYQTPKWQYVLTHEWGHAVDPQFLSGSGDFGMAGEVSQAWMEATREGGDMSNYGHTNSAEGFAEAFAEFYLTNGETQNRAAIDFAVRFGWKARNGRYA